MRNSVLIIDSGMRNLGGHNFSYTRSVQAALEKRGYGVTVLANKNLAGDVAKESGYHPVFSFGAYDFPPGNGVIRDLAYIYAQSVVYSDELEQAFKQTATEYSIVFCHTVNDFELIGWKRFLSRRKLPGHLMILMRQTPGFHSCSRWRRIAHPYWRIKPHYLNAIHARMQRNFVLLTDSEPLTEDYARVFHHRIVTLPIPVSELILNADHDGRSSNGFCKRYKLARDGRVCIGYMGDARSSKGFHLLPELIRRVSSSADAKTKFVIQCPAAASGYDSEQSADGVDELKKLAQEANGDITLISEKLSERDYAELFGHLDIVLAPYTTSNYAEATSGIFAEAMALAKPVVVPSNTWMARELKKSGGGLEFQRGDAVDLAAKVLEMARHYDVYASKAIVYGETWKHFHNCHKLADMLINESGLDSLDCDEQQRPQETMTKDERFERKR
jgi:glycosyltransferase involved in cell wall biosynthesis